eukprot:1169246-Pyramimonas_sp.AAC.1
MPEPKQWRCEPSNMPCRDVGGVSYGVVFWTMRTHRCACIHLHTTPPQRHLGSAGAFFEKAAQQRDDNA